MSSTGLQEGGLSKAIIERAAPTGGANWSKQKNGVASQSDPYTKVFRMGSLLGQATAA